MLPAATLPRKSSRRPRFRAPLWDDDHPALRRIDATLPIDHHARWLATVVSRLDLTALRDSYAGRGSDVHSLTGDCPAAATARVAANRTGRDPFICVSFRA